MQTKLKKRLSELRAELDAGKKMMAELDAKKADVQATVLRISGAIQVLEEILSEEGASLLEPERLEAE